jgi:hypothetical protein
MTQSPRSSIGCVQYNFWAYGTLGTNCAPILCQDWHCLLTDSNELPLEPCHLGVPPGASKMIFEPMVRSAQTVHLSCGKISTISKRNETSFHLSLITKEYHRVRPNRFLSVWNVWRKPSNNLAPTLTLSPKRLKRDSTCPMSPRSSIGCVQTEL